MVIVEVMQTQFFFLVSNTCFSIININIGKHILVINFSGIQLNKSKANKVCSNKQKLYYVDVTVKSKLGSYLNTNLWTIYNIIQGYLHESCEWTKVLMETLPVNRSAVPVVCVLKLCGSISSPFWGEIQESSSPFSPEKHTKHLSLMLEAYT